MEMNYCMRCGTKLGAREHPTDGLVPYCERCGDYRFPVFSAAVGIVVLNPDETCVILIRQYGKDRDMLVAGYVDKGETAEHAVRRELKEELGLEAKSVRYLGSHYYEPSETLMLSFAATVTELDAHPNFEVDSWRWYTLEEARTTANLAGLAKKLLETWKKAPETDASPA